MVQIAHGNNSTKSRRNPTKFRQEKATGLQACYREYLPSFDFRVEAGMPNISAALALLP